MSVAVIGGSGFVGLNIVEALLSRGLSVHVLDIIDPPSRVHDNFARLPGRCSIVALDVCDRRAMAAALSDPNLEAVVYAAAITADAERESRGMRAVVDVNIGGLVQLLDTLAPMPAVKVVYVGSSAVYGALPNRDKPIKEDWPQRPMSLYAVTKATAEQIVLRWSALHGRSAAISRLGWVFGPWERDTGVRDTMSPILQVTNAARDGKAIVLSRDATLDWLYVRDAGEAIARIAVNTPSGSGVYNLGPIQRWPISAWCKRLEAVYPRFQWSVSAGPGIPIDLYHDEDSAPLDSSSFQRTFGPLHWHELDRAFDDFVHGFFDPH
jgi:UDP-glucuronate 4-epimerase